MTRGWTDAKALLLALVWIPSTLWLDRSASLVGQLALGAMTWALLLWWLAHESRLVRAQTAVVVGIAAVIELVFSGWLGVYVYRLEHVPAYVFPGHGLIYLAALTFARLPVVRRNSSTAVRATVVVATARGRCGGCCSRRATTCSASSGTSACSRSCAGAARRCSTSARSSS